MPYPRFPKVFLSCSFDPADRPYFEWFRLILQALEFEVVSGEEPSTHSLPNVVRERIQSAHAFVGLLTRKTRVADSDDWLAPTWVRDEVAIAYSFNKPVAILAEDRVVVDGIVPQLSKYERWTREGLALAAPTIIRYFVAMRNELSPPSEDSGDLATMRALSEDLSGLAEALSEVETTQELNSFSWAMVVARHTGRFYTLPADLQQKVREAYQAIDRVEEALRPVTEARRGLKSSLKGALTFDFSPGPPLPADHPLVKKVHEAAERAREKFWPAFSALFKSGYPKEWAEMQRKVDSMPEGPQKEAAKFFLKALFEGNLPTEGES